MSPALEPMSFDELSELYRVEMKSSAITQVRKDLFRAMANLLTALRLEYDRQMALDPESVMCEGAEQRRKKAERLAKDVVHIRTQKICQMAIRGAMGGRNTVDMLTDEERDYYERVLDLSKRHMSEIDRLRGRKNTVATHIDEVHTVEESHPVTETAEPAPAEVMQSPDEIPFDDSPDDFQDEPIPDDFDDFSEIPPESGSVHTDVPPQADSHIPAPVGHDMTAEPPAAPEPAVDTGSVAEPEPVHHAETVLPQPEADELKPILIRVLEDLPEFAGPDRDYRLSKEDLVMLPRVLAEVLINTEKAVLIRPTP